LSFYEHEPKVKSSNLNMVIGFTFIFFIDYHIFYPIFPLYIIDIGASKFELGIIMSLFRGIAILATIPFGFFASRKGKWPTLFISIFIQLIAFLLYAISSHTIYLYPITIFYALSFASFGPISMSLALNSSAISERGKVMGKYFGAIGAAMIVGPVITSLLTMIFNFKQMLFAISILQICIFSLILGSRKNSINFSNLEGKNVEILSFKSILRILKKRNILTICFIQTTFYITTGTFDTLFPIYAKESLWLAVSSISILYAVRGFPNFLIRMPVGSLSDKIGRFKPIIIAHMLAFFAIFLIPDMKNMLFISLLMGIYGAAWGARIPPIAALLSDKVRTSEINLASSLLWLTSLVGMVIGSSIATSTLIIPLSIIIKASSAFLLIGILALLFVQKEK